MSESHTIGQLLDYIETNSFHTPDASVCDCGRCSTYASIILLAERMGERGE
jgi:hypothetical protein